MLSFQNFMINKKIASLNESDDIKNTENNINELNNIFNTGMKEKGLTRFGVKYDLDTLNTKFTKTKFIIVGTLTFKQELKNINLKDTITKIAEENFINGDFIVNNENKIINKKSITVLVGASDNQNSFRFSIVGVWE